MEESFLVLPHTDPRCLPEYPDDSFVFSCHGINNEETFRQMMQANEAAFKFLTGKISFFDYMDVLESIGIADPLQVMSEIMEPYVYNGLLL